MIPSVAKALHLRKRLTELLRNLPYTLFHFWCCRRQDLRGYFAIAKVKHNHGVLGNPSLLTHLGRHHNYPATFGSCWRKQPWHSTLRPELFMRDYRTARPPETRIRSIASSVLPRLD